MTKQSFHYLKDFAATIRPFELRLDSEFISDTHEPFSFAEKLLFATVPIHYTYSDRAKY